MIIRTSLIALALLAAPGLTFAQTPAATPTPTVSTATAPTAAAPKRTRKAKAAASAMAPAPATTAAVAAPAPTAAAAPATTAKAKAPRSPKQLAADQRRKACANDWQTAKTAGTTAGKKWPQFLGECMKKSA